MKLCLTICISLLCLLFGAASALEKDQRGGDCEQTKSQYDYFCTKQGDPAKDDIMTTANIACGNAKRNMAAACEGIIEKDTTYTFDKEGKPSASQ